MKVEWKVCKILGWNGHSRSMMHMQKAKTLMLIEKLPKIILTIYPKPNQIKNNYTKQKSILTEIPWLKKHINISTQ